MKTKEEYKYIEKQNISDGNNDSKCFGVDSSNWYDFKNKCDIYKNTNVIISKYAIKDIISPLDINDQIKILIAINNSSIATDDIYDTISSILDAWILIKINYSNSNLEINNEIVNNIEKFMKYNNNKQIFIIKKIYEFIHEDSFNMHLVLFNKLDNKLNDHMTNLYNNINITNVNKDMINIKYLVNKSFSIINIENMLEYKKYNNWIFNSINSRRRSKTIDNKKIKIMNSENLKLSNKYYNGFVQNILNRYENIMNNNNLQAMAYYTKYKSNTIIKWHRNEYAKEIIENYKTYNRNKINVQALNYGGYNNINIIPGESTKLFTEISNIINYYKNIKPDYFC